MTPVQAQRHRRGAAAHLGIELREYDARIRTFIPHYEEMLDVAAAALRLLGRPRPTILDLGTGSGALAARCLAAAPAAIVVGIDSDPGMLQAAQRRVGRRLMPILGDFTAAPLPRCDAITASFALHHVRTDRQKLALYRRCAGALRRGGLLVSADCHPASAGPIRTRDRALWVAHLRRWYPARTAERYLRAWAREDACVRLEDELTLLRGAGLVADVAWRRDAFAVIVATKPGARGGR